MLKITTPTKTTVSFVITEMNDNLFNSGVSKQYVFDEHEQREILLWFKKHKPEIWMEIFCEDHPELIESM